MNFVYKIQHSLWTWNQMELCGMFQKSCYLVSRISVHQSENRFHLAMFNMKSKIKVFSTQMCFLYCTFWVFSARKLLFIMAVYSIWWWWILVCVCQFRFDVDSDGSGVLVWISMGIQSRVEGKETVWALCAPVWNLSISAAALCQLSWALSSCANSVCSSHC